LIADVVGILQTLADGFRGGAGRIVFENGQREINWNKVSADCLVELLPCRLPRPRRIRRTLAAYGAAFATDEGSNGMSATAPAALRSVRRSKLRVPCDRFELIPNTLIKLPLSVGSNCDSDLAMSIRPSIIINVAGTLC
jgi:hypothetical protein